MIHIIHTNTDKGIIDMGKIGTCQQRQRDKIKSGMIIGRRQIMNPRNLEARISNVVGSANFTDFM